MKTVEKHWPALVAIVITITLAASALVISPKGVGYLFLGVTILAGALALIACVTFGSHKLYNWAKKQYGSVVASVLVGVIVLSLFMLGFALTFR